MRSKAEEARTRSKAEEARTRSEAAGATTASVAEPATTPSVAARARTPAKAAPATTTSWAARTDLSVPAEGPPASAGAFRLSPRVGTYEARRAFDHRRPDPPGAHGGRIVPGAARVPGFLGHRLAARSEW